MIANDLFFKTKKTTPKWCKRCARKHSRWVACNLEKLKDLTSRKPERVKPLKIKADVNYSLEEPKVKEGRKVGHYRVRIDPDGSNH